MLSKFREKNVKGSVQVLMKYFAVGEVYCAVIQKDFLLWLANDMSVQRFSDVL